MQIHLETDECEECDGFLRNLLSHHIHKALADFSDAAGRGGIGIEQSYIGDSDDVKLTASWGPEPGKGPGE